MKKCIAILMAVALIMAFAPWCANMSEQSEAVNRPQVFNIGGDMKDVGDYSEIEKLFFQELEENGLSDYEMYDSSELSVEVLENRIGTTIVERCVGIVTHAESGDEHGIVLNAYNPEYNYIGYRTFAQTADITDGTVVLSYMIYNPDNNYIDDIIERYDFVISREYED